MNLIELSDKIDVLRNICANKKKYDIDLYFGFDNELLNIYKYDKSNDEHKYFLGFDNFSMSNLKKLLSVMKKERLDINKIEIKY